MIHAIQIKFKKSKEKNEIHLENQKSHNKKYSVNKQLIKQQTSSHRSYILKI